MKTESIDMWRGAELAAKNSRELFDSANVLAVQHKYGVASSLMILANEEATKSSMFLGFALTGNDASGFFKYMRIHKNKHDVASFTAFFREAIGNLISSIEDIEKKILPREEKMEMLLERTKEWSDAAINEEVEELNEIMDWKSSANETKNLGLYVDVNDYGWSSPQDFTEDCFLKQRAQTQPSLEALEHAILAGLEQLREFHRKTGIAKADDHFP